MPIRAVLVALTILLAAVAAGAATVERAEELYLSGDLGGARAEIDSLLEIDDDATRASALKLLGRLESDAGNWAAALEAWGELTDSLALSPQAAAVSAAIRPLQALVECGCQAADEPEMPTSAQAPAAPASVPAPAPQAAVSRSETPATPPAPPVAPATGLYMVGGWGGQYEATQEATAALIEFLRSEGVGLRPGSTEIPAIRGEDVVLSYLVEEAREAGADGVLYITARFGYREYIQLGAYDLDGQELWLERITGGTALKERRNRDQVNWSLVERLKKRIAKHIGSPDLPTRP